MFSSDYCEISKNNFFYRTPTAASSDSNGVLSLYALIINSMRKLEPYSFSKTKFQTHYQWYQSFLYENHCDCYKKLASISWPVIFTLTIFLYFFLYMQSPLLMGNKRLLWSLFSYGIRPWNHCSMTYITILF